MTDSTHQSCLPLFSGGCWGLPSSPLKVYGRLINSIILQEIPESFSAALELRKIFVAHMKKKGLLILFKYITIIVRFVSQTLLALLGITAGVSC